MNVYLTRAYWVGGTEVHFMITIMVLIQGERGGRTTLRGDNSLLL